MTANEMSIAEVLIKDKLNPVHISVAEVPDVDDLDTPERLTIHSPPLRPVNGGPMINGTDFVGGPPHHSPGRLRASSPTGSVRSSYSSSHRHVVRRRHFSSGFSRSHRSEVSKELKVQAESEFLALMELMSSMSRRSISLKEVWTKILLERESCSSEMDRLYEKFEEYEEIISCHEKEKHGHTHELEEQKRELVKLRLDLKASISAKLELNAKLTERDVELSKAHHEISEFKDNYKYINSQYESTKKTLEKTHSELLEYQESCTSLEHENKKHHGELRTLRQQFTELEESRSEVTKKYESTHKEVISLKALTVVLQKEKHDWRHEREDLQEELGRCKSREEEYVHKIKELDEHYEKKKHEVRELHEKISKSKYEKEELHREVKSLKVEVEEYKRKRDEADDTCRKWKRKHEECLVELSTLRADITVLRTEHESMTETITRKSEEIKKLTIEIQRHEEDYHEKCNEVKECHRQIHILKETHTRLESTITEKTQTIHEMSERIERIESDCNAACQSRDDYKVELDTCQSAIASLNIQLEATLSECNSVRERLHDCEFRYERVCETMEHYHESGDGREADLIKLRDLLHEVRKEKERAIEMRANADRERDETIARYEIKCRDFERLDEEFAAHKAEHHRYGGRRSGLPLHGHPGLGHGGRYLTSAEHREEEHSVREGSVFSA